MRRFGDLEVDPAAREARRAGKTVDLTKLEFDLLDVLSGEPRVAFSRERLLERVWAGNGSAMITSSTCTSAICAPSSAMTRAPRGTCERSAASATGWETVDESSPLGQPRR